MILRPYQNRMSEDINRAWAGGHSNVIAALPTGAGKTVLFGNKVSQEPGVAFVIAHRQELIFQISMALAKFGVVHNILADEKIVRWAIRMHLKTFGRHFCSTQSDRILVGVRTLLNRADKLSRYINQTKLWVIDECHHITEKNEWGKAVALFPGSAHGLGVTATPMRADGTGLGRGRGGVMDTIITGPGMRDLINEGFLSEYRIFAPKTAIDMSDVTIGSTGDFSKPKLAVAVGKSQIIGDVVGHYLKIAPGKIGVTFVTDVATGKDMARNYNASGVPSALVHAKTGYKERQESVAKLRRGDLKNIVNVDIFGEGFDLPAIEVVSFARPTASYVLYVQQFGRGLRPMGGKSHGIIIDHVGNVERHGLPDSPREWSLAARERGSRGKVEGVAKIRTCIECTAVYEAYLRECPFCGCLYQPEGRGSIEQVEGDLLELSPEVLASMRGEIARIDAPESTVGNRLGHAGAPGMAVAAAMKNHRLRSESQAELRDSIALWAGYQRAAGISDNNSYRRFLGEFGVDVMTAQTLGRRDAAALKERIDKEVSV